MATDNSDLEEYTDPEEYDRENGLGGPDLDYYLDLAREVGGPALDLACGTGFLTIPFAELGLAVTGVDRAPAMLDQARRKAGALPIRWLRADCRALDLGERFRLVTLTGNAFQEFLTRQDQEGLLGSVRRHLAPEGRFAFETRFPARPSFSRPRRSPAAGRKRPRGGGMRTSAGRPSPSPRRSATTPCGSWWSMSSTGAGRRAGAPRCARSAPPCGSSTRRR